MKPTVFAVLLFVGILSTMWLAAVNHNAAQRSPDHTVITAEIGNAIQIGMTMEEVVALLGQPDDTEVANTPGGAKSVRALWKGAHHTSVYLRFIDDTVTDILSRP